MLVDSYKVYYSTIDFSENTNLLIVCFVTQPKNMKIDILPRANKQLFMVYGFGLRFLVNRYLTDIVFG